MLKKPYMPQDLRAGLQVQAGKSPRLAQPFRELSHALVAQGIPWSGSQGLHVDLWHIQRPQNSVLGTPLRLMYILHGYMEPLGMPHAQAHTRGTFVYNLITCRVCIYEKMCLDLPLVYSHLFCNAFVFPSARRLVHSLGQDV